MSSKSEEKLEFILRSLNEFFPSPEPPLLHESGFQLLIATLLSGQSTDATVNRVTPKLFKNNPDARSILFLSQSEIAELIKPCGLFQKKSAFILGIARQLFQNNVPDVPNNFEELIKLPGIGRKTASVVLAQWFGMQAFPVDTHIMRLAKRWKLSNQHSPEKIERDLIQTFKNQNFNKLHLQLVYYGRFFCRAKKHNENECFICRNLRFFN